MTEPHLREDDPENVVLYVSGQTRSSSESLLMELELAGAYWEPRLKQVARNVLRERYTAGVIDKLLAPEAVTYEELARAAGGTSPEPPSVLKTIFHDRASTDELLGAWLVSDEHDGEIQAKEAVPELQELVKSRLGLQLSPNAALEKLRSITLRYVLGSEFRADLSGTPPATVAALPAPATKEEDEAARKLALHLRMAHVDRYPDVADTVETELNLRDASVAADALGAIDTFRFEERLLHRRAGELIAEERFDHALEIIEEREESFWVTHDVSRRAQWQALRLMAELGAQAARVKSAVEKAHGDADTWVASYSAENGWYLLDLAQRRLETLVSSLDDDPDERPLGVVRRAYEDAANAMALGFTKALIAADWSIPGPRHQTHVWPDVLATRPKPVAYFFIDAMRYEMGTELKERLPETSEVSLSPAVAALPSITPVGMAALLPNASSSFSVVEKGGRLGSEVDGSFLGDRPARGKFLAARVPDLVDMTLGEVLSFSAAKLTKRVADAQVVVVRSQEIDFAGEGGLTHQARQVMDTVINNIARALKKLAAAGIQEAVISADHGHLYFPADREEAMRMDNPGGDQVQLHRRCWIGRGGATPPGCVRVSAAKLGYESDLEFVFPLGLGVFKAGGDLAFHHGGPSLQELIVPVLTVRTPTGETKAVGKGDRVTATDVPSAITSRIFTAKLQLGGENLALFAETKAVRPLLMSEGQQVGTAGMAVGAEFDAGTGLVALEPGAAATVGFVLSDDSVSALRLVVQDPVTDAELYRSPADIPVQLGVA